MKHALIICVESGLLEQQAVLLINSFNKYAFDENVQFFVFSPRQNSQPDESSIAFFKNHNVTHITEPLNTGFLEYPIANKILCCAYFEKNKNYKSIMFLDTDTAFLNNFNFNKFKKAGLYLKPVGHKGPGTAGLTDSNENFWLKVFSLFGLELPPVKFRTTIEDVAIRGYFNAGLIWSINLPGFFQQWAKDFFKLIDSGLKPEGFISKDFNNFRCLDQVALAVTASRYENYVHVLPKGYNYHLPFKPMMVESNKIDFENLTHVHYHKWFQHPDFLDHITTQEDKKTEKYQWLKKQLPLKPFIDDPFKC